MFLAHIQKWTKNETREGREIETDEQPQIYALRVQKSATDFNRTKTNAQKVSYEETVENFRTHIIEKSLMFSCRLAKWMQHPREILTDCLRGLKCLALKAYPGGSNEIREHLVVHGFLMWIHNSYVRLGSRKILMHAEMTTERILAKASNLDAVKRFTLLLWWIASEIALTLHTLTLLRTLKRFKVFSLNKVQQLGTIARFTLEPSKPLYQNEQNFAELKQLKKESFREKSGQYTDGKKGLGYAEEWGIFNSMSMKTHVKKLF